jgi:hypothetical protein
MYCWLYCCLYCLQAMMVKEVFKLARHAQAERKLPGFRAQQWYYFFVAAFWVYIRCALLIVLLPARANAWCLHCGNSGEHLRWCRVGQVAKSAHELLTERQRLPLPPCPALP